jgi:hypothetical protein
MPTFVVLDMNRFWGHFSVVDTMGLEVWCKMEKKPSLANFIRKKERVSRNIF